MAGGSGDADRVLQRWVDRGSGRHSRLGNSHECGKGQIRSHGPDHPSSFARMSTTNCMFAISVPIWSESDCFGPAGWTSCSKSLMGQVVGRIYRPHGPDHTGEVTMKFSKTFMMTVFAVLIGSSGTIAQTAPTAKPVAAQRSSAAKSTSDTDKKVIS